jgi:hypothetical protein
VQGLESSVDGFGGLDISDSQKARITEDMKYIVYLARQLNQMNETMFKAALDRDDSKVKAAAILIASKYKDKYLEEIIERITDDDIIISQCARRSLIQISNIYIGGREYVDFGPLLNHHSATKNSISILWKVWFEQAKQAQKDGKKPQPSVKQKSK